jgi:hypothetical protein
MPRKPARKWDDPEESKRFLETAEAVEASSDPADFDKALKAVAPKKDIAKPR